MTYDKSDFGSAGSNGGCGRLSTRFNAAEFSTAVVTLLFLVFLTACERPVPPSQKATGPTAEEIKAGADQFEWPEEPSHVIALELKDRGTIRIGLYDQVAPKSVAHVVDCVTRGVYDDTLFHRVIKDFMIQGGDPATRKRGPGTTRGNWGDLSIEDEFNLIHHDRGVVALGNRGRPGSAGSQFFIVHRDSHHLDGKYTAFGRVLEGIEVVDAVAEVETDLVGRWGKKNTPLEPVILTRAILERGSVANLPRTTPIDMEAADPRETGATGADLSIPDEASEIASRG